MPEDEVDAFLDEVGFDAWNHEQDAGAPWGPAVEAARGAVPAPPRAAGGLPGPVPGRAWTARSRAPWRSWRSCTRPAPGWWPSPTGRPRLFPHAEATFDFLALFEGIVVSGREGVAKPDPAVFDLLLEPLRPRPGPHRLRRRLAGQRRRSSRGRPAGRWSSPAPTSCAATSAGSACSTVPDQADAVAHGQHHHLDPVVGEHLVVERLDAPRCPASVIAGSSTRPLQSTLSTRITPSGASLARVASKYAE